MAQEHQGAAVSGLMEGAFEHECAGCDLAAVTRTSDPRGLGAAERVETLLIEWPRASGLDAQVRLTRLCRPCALRLAGRLLAEAM